MKTISLKLDEAIFSDTEEIVSSIKKPRNRYINEALRHYNRLYKRKLLEKKLSYESKLVRNESMNVLEDFDQLEYGD
jgi:metal-responsive CopG/Arc/MetJ family transcriptional regulator